MRPLETLRYYVLPKSAARAPNGCAAGVYQWLCGGVRKGSKKSGTRESALLCHNTCTNTPLI